MGHAFFPPPISKHSPANPTLANVCVFPPQTAPAPPAPLERSETGWASVDISQYTDKEDDDKARSPTPQPTIDYHRHQQVRLGVVASSGIGGAGAQSDHAVVSPVDYTSSDYHPSSSSPPSSFSSTPSSSSTSSPHVLVSRLYQKRRQNKQIGSRHAKQILKPKQQPPRPTAVGQQETSFSSASPRTLTAMSTARLLNVSSYHERFSSGSSSDSEYQETSFITDPSEMCKQTEAESMLSVSVSPSAMVQIHPVPNEREGIHDPIESEQLESNTSSVDETFTDVTVVGSGEPSTPARSLCLPPSFAMKPPTVMFEEVATLTHLIPQVTVLPDDSLPVKGGYPETLSGHNTEQCKQLVVELNNPSLDSEHIGSDDDTTFTMLDTPGSVRCKRKPANSFPDKPDIRRIPPSANTLSPGYAEYPSIVDLSKRHTRYLCYVRSHSADERNYAKQRMYVQELEENGDEDKEMFDSVSGQPRTDTENQESPSEGREQRASSSRMRRRSFPLHNLGWEGGEQGRRATTAPTNTSTLELDLAQRVILRQTDNVIY